MLFNKKLSQGEIFGIALFFVILIIGLLVYAQIRALNPSISSDQNLDDRYKILAETSKYTILDISTGCYTGRGRDSIKDLIDHCLRNSPNQETKTALFLCDGVTSVNTCEKSLKMLENTLNLTYSENGIGKIPYRMEIRLPRSPQSIFNTNITNFNQFQTNEGDILSETNYRRNGYKRAPSGLRAWPTAFGNIEIELFLYYR